MVTVKSRRLGNITVKSLRVTGYDAVVLRFASEAGNLVGIVTHDSVTVFDPEYPDLAYDDAAFADPLREAISEWIK
jgi:hypothetical protein